MQDYQQNFRFGPDIVQTPTRYIPSHLVSTNPRDLPISFPLNTGSPALAPQQPPPANRPALAGATGNARGSIRQPALQMPNQRIGLGEAMIRMGGAGMAGASQGGLASMGAMTSAYGDIMDYNRAREMEEYNAQVAAANEEQRRKDALAARMARSAGKAKDGKPDADVSREINNMTAAIEALKQGGLTGYGDGTVRAILDRSGLNILGYGGDTEKAAKRLLLEEMAVFATLEFTSKTKGAITDREMALFQRPIPKITDDENVWIAWIEPRLEILRQVQQNGMSNERAAEVGGPTTSSPAPTVSEDILNEADSIVNGG